MTNRRWSVRVDLNVTPLIDILLVLLVFFMATLPLAQQGIDATVPADVQTRSVEPVVGQIVVRYQADGQMSINQQTVSLMNLADRLRDIYRTRNDKTIYVIGDGRLRYGAIVEVMDAARAAAVERLGVVTEDMRRAASGAM